MDKKNLDELFREKFETFREVPDEKVWTAIENSLDKKRKKRIIPLWWQLGGVAAVLAIALVAFYSLKDSGDDTPILTNTEKTKDNDTNQHERDAELKRDEEDALQIPKVTEDAVVKRPQASDPTNTDKYFNSEGDGLSRSEKSFPNDKSKTQDDVLQIPEINEDAVANSTKEDRDKNTDKYTDSEPDIDSFQDEPPNIDMADTEATPLKNKSTKDSVNRSPEKTQLATNKSDSDRKFADSDPELEDKNNVLKKDKTLILSEGHKDAVAIADSSISKKTNTPKTDSKTDTQNGIVTGQETPKTITENLDIEIAQNDQIEKNTVIGDTQTDENKNDENKKSIFEVLEAQNAEEELVEESAGRWSAGPNVAPVYFNAMGEGSPIDPGFSPNAKSGSTNLSYGLSIAYAVTKKLSVRSGIHKAEYGYNTNNVGFSPTLAASTGGRLQNIDYVGDSESLALNDAVSNSDSPNSLASEFSSLNSARDGTIAQSFGYLEVPLELDYALIDRRFGVNLVGAIISLFLIDNSVSLNSGKLTAEIGEARNLNDVNFSTNIGFGVNYKFTPKVQLNIEPVFKYQLNTFSEVSGDFRPFSIGIYSGLNFKF